MLVEFPVRETSALPEAQTIRSGRPLRRPAAVHLSEEVFTEEVPKKRKETADPLKDPDDILKVTDYLIIHHRYRDYLLFVMGINLGLRCGDLLKLKVGHLISDDGESYRDVMMVREQKTKKLREAYLNDAICDAADLYFAHCGEVSMNDYLFKSDCNRVKAKEEPITVRSVERILKEVINEACGIDIHVGTHTMRKTFSYHILMNAPDRTRALEFLQKILGHSSASITLAYAGITQDEVRDTYLKLNLGQHSPFQWQLRGKLVG